MPRRTKKKKGAESGNTYYKAKNGRFYKKVEIDGKMRVRFVSNAEATGAMKSSDSKPSKKRKPRAKKVKPQEEPQPSPAKASAESDEKQES